MFVGFFAFSHLRKVRGFRSSLGGPNYARCRGEATFFSSRRYGRFSLHSGRCDACAIRLNIAFFHVFWFPTNGIPIWQGAFFGRQIGPPKREHSKTVQNVQCEKRTPNLSIPLCLVRRRFKTARIRGRLVHKSWSFEKLCQVREIVSNRNNFSDFSHGNNEPK